MTTIIVNTRSGTTPAGAKDYIAAKFGDMGHTLNVIDFGIDDIESEIERHIGTSEAPIIAWGGDGTICFVLDIVDNRLPVLAIPGGTMNMVHRKIHGRDTNVEELTEAFKNDELEESELTKGSANGHSFYVAAMLGELTQLTDVRESIRQGRPLNALNALVSSDVFNFDQDLKVSGDGKLNTGCLHDAAALAAFINESGLGFDVGQINPHSLAELLAIGLEASISDWKDAGRIAFTQQRSVLVEAKAPVVKSTLDGEPAELTLPVKIDILAEGSRVLKIRSSC